MSALDNFLVARDKLLADLDDEGARLRERLAEITAQRATIAGRSARARSKWGATLAAIVAWLETHPGAHSALDVATGVGIVTSHARVAIGRLCTAGKVTRTQRGRYERPSPQPAPTPRRETPADRLARISGARAGGAS